MYLSAVVYLLAPVLQAVPLAEAVAVGPVMAADRLGGAAEEEEAAPVSGAQALAYLADARRRAVAGFRSARRHAILRRAIARLRRPIGRSPIQCFRRRL